MKNIFTNIKSYFLFSLIYLLMIGNIWAKPLLLPSTPVVVVTPPSGANCYSIVTASGCGTARTQWYSKHNSIYTLLADINPLTVISETAVTLRAACYDPQTNQYAYSADYKVFSATTTDIITTTAPSGCTSLANLNITTLNASSATSGLSYQWKNSGANISGATNASYSTTTEGLYELVASNGTCSSSRKVAVSSPSSLPYLYANYTGTCGNQTLTFAQSGIGPPLPPASAGTYQWMRNGSAISGATSIGYSTTTDGQYVLKYSPTGCSTSFYLIPTSFNQANTSPIISQTPLKVSLSCLSELKCTGCNTSYGSMRVLSRPAGTTVWTTNSLTQGTFIEYGLLGPPTPTDYQFDYTTSGAGNCSVLSNIVTAYPPFYSSITPTNGTACAGGSVLLTANLAQPATVMYQWKLYSNEIPGATSPTYVATQNGDYSVVTSNGTCSYTSASVPVSINPSTYGISPTFSGACGSQTVVLSLSSPFGIPPGTYQWKLNGIAISGATNTTYSATTTGTYTADFTPTGCSLITSSPFVFTQTTPSAPVATLNPPVGFSCSSTLSSSTCDGSSRPQLQRNTGSGFFNVSPLFATISSQSAWEYRYVCVNGTCVSPPSNVVVGNSNLFTEVLPASSSVCTGTSLTLRFTYPGASYQWIKDGIDIPGATSTSYAVTQSGAYSVRVTKANCTDFTSAVSNIAVSSAFPTITPILGGTCANPSVQLVAFPTLGIFQWKRNGIAISGATSVSYTTSVEGIYTLDYTNGNCTATTLPYNFFINTAPTITLSPPTPASCIQTLSAASCPSLVKWEQDLGAGWTVFTTTTTPIQVPNVASSFRAKCVSGSCDSPPSNVIVVTPYLFTEVTSIRDYLCGVGPPTPLLLTATSTFTGMTYQWKKNGVDIPGATSSTYSASTVGGYTVVVTKDGCTYTSDLKNIYTVTPSILSLNASLTGSCGNQTANMSTTLFAGLTYVWRRNGTVIAGQSTNTYSSNIAGDYTVETNIYTTDCNDQSAPYAFTQVGLPPTATFSAVTPPSCGAFLSSMGCTGQTRWYKQANANVWNFDGSGTPYYPSTNIVSQFRATCLINTCETNPSNIITYTPNLFTQITPNPATICPGGSTDLTAVSTFSGLNYQWKLNGNDIVGATNATFTATQTGTYTLSVNNIPAAACGFITPPLVISAGVPLTISSLASGNWNVAATWSCNCIPTSCDNVTVETGHTVTIPVSQTGKLKNLTVKGLVDMKSPSSMKLK